LTSEKIKIKDITYYESEFKDVAEAAGTTTLVMTTLLIGQAVLTNPNAIGKILVFFAMIRYLELINLELPPSAADFLDKI